MRHPRPYARARLCRRELVVGEVSKVEALPASSSSRRSMSSSPTGRRPTRGASRTNEIRRSRWMMTFVVAMQPL